MQYTMEYQKGKPTCVYTLHTVGPLKPWVQPWMLNFPLSLSESIDAEPVDTEGWPSYTILYKGPEHHLILVHSGVLEPIPHRNWGTTVFSQKSLKPKGKCDPVNFKLTMQWMKEKKSWKGMTCQWSKTWGRPSIEAELKALTNFTLIIMLVLVKAIKGLLTFSPMMEEIILKGELKCSNPCIFSFA